MRTKWSQAQRQGTHSPVVGDPGWPNTTQSSRVGENRGGHLIRVTDLNHKGAKTQLVYVCVFVPLWLGILKQTHAETSDGTSMLYFRILL